MTQLQSFEKTTITLHGQELDVYYENTPNGISLRDTFKRGTKQHVSVDVNDQDTVIRKISDRF